MFNRRVLCSIDHCGEPVHWLRRNGPRGKRYTEACDSVAVYRVHPKESRRFDSTRVKLACVECHKLLADAVERAGIYGEEEENPLF